MASLSFLRTDAITKIQLCILAYHNASALANFKNALSLIGLEEYANISTGEYSLASTELGTALTTMNGIGGSHPLISDAKAAIDLIVSSQAGGGGSGSGFGTPQNVGDSDATITRAGAVSTVVLTTTATAARVLTTPASPQDNDLLFIFDAADGGASTPTFTFSLRRNGSATINGSASDVVISPSLSGYKLFAIAVYHAASTNWNLDIVATPASKESISGLTLSDNPLFNNVQVNHTTANSVNGSTAIDFNLAGFRTLNLSGNVTFTSSNLAAGKSVTRRIVCDGSTRTFTFPGGWIFVQPAGAPANIAASKVGVLTLGAFGSTDADVIATWNVQP